MQYKVEMCHDKRFWLSIIDVVNVQFAIGSLEYPSMIDRDFNNLFEEFRFLCEYFQFAAAINEYLLQFQKRMYYY